MSRERKLSTEDRILWGKIARTTRPLPGRLEELLEFSEQFQDDSSAEIKSHKKPLANVPPAEPVQVPKQRGTHHPLERPVRRKLSRGHLALEARLDLHGLIQSEAHSVLLDFLIRAHERGLRHVLVITGKGSSLGSDGALKRAVPLWFSKPQFRFLISSFETAAHHHGGEGALYIRLARRGKEGI